MSAEPTGPAGPTEPKGRDVVTLGETMALVAASGTGPFTVEAAARISFGGAETNLAIGLCRLGHSATWIGRFGADPLGAMIVGGLRAESVDVSQLVLDDSGAPTGLMLRERRTTDRVRVSYYRSASAGSRLGPADVSEEAVASARILHVSGITPALSDSARKAVHRAVEIARACGVAVSFDLNYRAALWSRADAGREFAALLASADLVFAGDDEAALAVGSGDPETLAARIAEYGPRDVVIKLGSDGVYALAGGSTNRHGAIAVSAIDPVGAGDACVAGYLSGVLDGTDLAERMERAAVCGAFAVSVDGDWEGAPRRHELGMLAGSENVAR